MYAQGESPRNATLSETMKHFMAINYRELSKSAPMLDSDSPSDRLWYSSFVCTQDILCSSPQGPSFGSAEERVRAIVPRRISCCVCHDLHSSRAVHHQPRPDCEVLGAVDTRFLVCGTFMPSYSFLAIFSLLMRVLQVMLGSVVTHGGITKTAQAALGEVRLAYGLFGEAAKYGGRAVKFLVSVILLLLTFVSNPGYSLLFGGYMIKPIVPSLKGTRCVARISLRLGNNRMKRTPTMSCRSSAGVLAL